MSLNSTYPFLMASCQKLREPHKHFRRSLECFLRGPTQLHVSTVLGLVLLESKPSSEVGPQQLMTRICLEIENWDRSCWRYANWSWRTNETLRTLGSFSRLDELACLEETRLWESVWRPPAWTCQLCKITQITWQERQLG